MKIIGFDGQPEGKQGIKEGKIYADPIQFPDQIGRMTVDSIVRYFAGEEVPAVQLIPTALYRQADAREGRRRRHEVRLGPRTSRIDRMNVLDRHADYGHVSASRSWPITAWSSCCSCSAPSSAW